MSLFKKKNINNYLEAVVYQVFVILGMILVSTSVELTISQLVNYR